MRPTTFVVVALGWGVCGLAASLAMGQTRSELFNFEQLVQEAEGRDAAELEQYRRRLANPQQPHVERLLAELTATRSAEARQIVMDYLQKAIGNRSVSREVFSAMTTALPYLGLRIRHFDRDPRLIQFLTDYAQAAEQANLTVPGYPDDPRRDLVAAAIYGLANAGQREAVQQFAQRYPDIVETAVRRIQTLPPLPSSGVPPRELSPGESPSTEVPSTELPSPAWPPTQPPAQPDAAPGDLPRSLPDRARPRPRSAAFQPWQWNSNRDRFETELHLGGRRVLTAVLYPESTSDQHPLGWVWNPATDEWFAYDFGSQRYVDPKTRLPRVPAPDMRDASGSAAPRLRVPDLPPPPEQPAVVEGPGDAEESLPQETPATPVDPTSSAGFEAWRWNAAAGRYETELRLEGRNVVTAVLYPAADSAEAPLGWVWHPASRRWFAFDFASQAYVDSETKMPLRQAPRVRAAFGKQDRSLTLPDLPEPPDPKAPAPPAASEIEGLSEAESLDVR